MRIEFDSRGFEQFERALGGMASRAIPHAVRNGLNKAAFEARKSWQAQIKEDFVLRNKYTVGSIRYTKARGVRLSQMEASVGSVADYMALQEKGGTIGKEGKHGVSIPTPSAAGQGMKTQPRTKPVQKKNYLSAIRLRRRVSGARQRKNAVAIIMALKTGSRVAFLDLGRRKGFFRILGGGDQKGRLRVRMIWDVSKPAVSIPATPTLKRTLEDFTPRMAGFYVDALQDQIERQRRLSRP